MASAAFPVVLFILILVCKGLSKFDIRLTNGSFEGGVVYFPVKRAKLQEHLNEINSQFDNEDVRLLLPSKPVLQDKIACDEHIVMVVYGRTEALAFNEPLTCREKQTVSTKADLLLIQIPYLMSRNGDSRKFTLQEKIFSLESRKLIQASAILPPPILADKFVWNVAGNNTDIQFEKGDLQLHLSGEHHGPCASRREQEINDVRRFEREFQISKRGPDFTICDQLPDLQVDFCDVYRDPLYNAVLKEAGSNVCITWEQHDPEFCKVTFRVKLMSKEMEDFLMLEKDQDVLESVTQSSTADIRIVFPCIE